jgi:hypothetical protein
MKRVSRMTAARRFAQPWARHTVDTFAISVGATIRVPCVI